MNAEKTPLELQVVVANPTSHYELIDAGEGQKLERFGSNTVIRPEPAALWNCRSPKEWKKATTIVTQSSRSTFAWKGTASLPDKWTVDFDVDGLVAPLRFNLKCAQSSQHVGVFPEHAPQWSWIAKKIGESDRPVKMLNLFGYTGASSLVAAAVGAEVCHVDSSASALNQARENQRLCGFDDVAIRWIEDDCAAFLAREIKRGKTYDAIVLDPPAFGRGKGNKVFKFSHDIQKILSLCSKLLVKQPLFFIFNGYAAGYSSLVLANLLRDQFSKYDIKQGELVQKASRSNVVLPSAGFAFFEK